MIDPIRRIDNLFSEIEHIEIKNFIDNIFNSNPNGGSNNRYVVKLDRAAGKKYCQMSSDMFIPSMFDKISDAGKQINSKAIFSTVNITRYSKDYGNPQLAPHFDRPSKVLFIIDYQASSNVDWPINVEGVDYSIIDNEAIVIETTKKIHWRRPQVFKDGEYVTVIFFGFEDPDKEISNQSGHTEILAKYYPEYSKKLSAIGIASNLLPKLIEMYEASERDNNV